MKRIASICAALLVLSVALVSSAFAAEESPVCYPTAISVSDNGTELKKIYDLSPEADPAGIPRSDFERNGFHYTFVDILRQELPEYVERQHTETVTVNSPKKDMESVLALLPQEREVVTDDGLIGTLTLKLDTVRVEVAGYGSSTKELTATRTYPNLDGQDTSYIPKTVEDNGRTLTLQTINWQASSSDNVDGYAIAERYTAVATYSGTATSSYVSGYTVTADYIGTVSHISLDRVRYVAIFEGVSLAPEEPEPTETPAPVETPVPTEAPSAEIAPSADQQDVQKSMEEPSAAFPWKLVVIPFGIIALIGAGVGVALTMKRRSEVSESGESEDEDE
jgi:hypothetical protein